MNDSSEDVVIAITAQPQLRLSLSPDEAIELSRLVQGAIGDLSMEISDTDNPTFRARLRHRKELLSAIGAKLTEL